MFGAGTVTKELLKLVPRGAFALGPACEMEQEAAVTAIVPQWKIGLAGSQQCIFGGFIPHFLGAYT